MQEVKGLVVSSNVKVERGRVREEGRKRNEERTSFCCHSRVRKQRFLSWVALSTDSLGKIGRI